MDTTDELLFRILFTLLWVIFIANLSWIRYSSWAGEPKGRAPAARADLPQSRLHILALALFAPFWFAGIILYILIPGWIAFLSFPLPDWLRFIMAGVAALSLPFTLWGFRTLGRNWVHALEPSAFLKKKQAALVTGGPYRYVRNPIYLGCFVFIIALALLAANWLLLLPALVLISIVYAQIPGEERMLEKRFGDEYREYMERTPRIIPGL
jgi:protein-S-isoprenylcysteine O-methyltransferase Ste14